MAYELYTKEQIIEWWKICLMKEKKCKSCPFNDDCSRLTLLEDYYHFIKTIAFRAAELLYDELKREKNWISVEDDLPKKSGDVIVAIADGVGGYLTSRTVPWSSRHRAFNVLDSNDDTSSEITGVTHWMPIPESPKARQ